MLKITTFVKFYLAASKKQYLWRVLEVRKKRKDYVPFGLSHERRR